MIEPELLPDKRIRIPRPVVGDEGEIGEAADVIAPGDPEYAEWATFIAVRALRVREVQTNGRTDPPA
jgi:hypothetical protein